MSENFNTGNVTVNLVNVYKETISDDVKLIFNNQDAKSFSRTYDVPLRGQLVVLTGVPAAPKGHYEVLINPTKYRYKKVFLHVVGGEENLIKEEHFVDPDHANPRLIDFADLPAKSYFPDLERLLSGSHLDEAKWNGLDKQNRATILNLCCKMVKEKTSDGESVIKKVNGIDQTWLNVDHRERIYSPVANGFLEELQALPPNFKLVGGGMHHFPNDWLSVAGDNSFKSKDAAGNIQFTFATDGPNNNQYYCDIDLDDAAGVKHALQVMGHKLTKVETNPYNIHEILVRFQGLDPEYRLL